MARGLPTQVEGDTDSGSTNSGAPVQVGGVAKEPAAETVDTRQPIKVDPATGGVLFRVVGTDQSGLIKKVSTVDPTAAIPRDNTREGLLVVNLPYAFISEGFTDVVPLKVQERLFVQNISANGFGNSLSLGQHLMSTHSILVSRVAGSTDVVDIRLEGNNYMNNWYTILQITSLAGGTVYKSVGNTPARFIRYNIVDIGAGNTLEIALASTIF